MQNTHGMTGMSGDAEDQKPKRFLLFGTGNLGQSCPHPCPQQNPQGEENADVPESNPLGEPLTIREVAQLLGCSPWTVRHRYLREGLPHLRTGPTGKLIFYRHQVIRWVLAKQQQKGGL